MNAPPGGGRPVRGPRHCDVTCQTRTPTGQLARAYSSLAAVLQLDGLDPFRPWPARSSNNSTDLAPATTGPRSLDRRLLASR
jgi:hypothetical protein